MGRGKDGVETAPRHESKDALIAHTSCASKLFDSAGDGNIDAVKRYLESPEISLCELRDKKGSTPLHYAAGNGHFEVCRFLLQTVFGQGKETTGDTTAINATAISYINSPNKTQGRTALHWAARNGHLSICKLLVEDYGADPDPLAKGDVTPLQLAVWRGHVDVCIWLSQAGTANKHFVNGWGCTVHHWLAKSPIYAEEQEQQTQQTKELNDFRCNSDSISAETKLLTLCQWLDDEQEENDKISKSTKVSAWNRPNDHGQTPLHKAGFGGNLPVLKFLIESKGCCDTHRDSQHNTAADCAERNRQWKAAKYLRRYGNPRCLQTASKILFGKSLPEAPKLSEIRGCYLKLAKLYHPDRLKTTENEVKRWRDLQQAYKLWTLWWEDPEEADAMIRALERHQYLQRQLPLLLLWHETWHENEQRENIKDDSVESKTKVETNVDSNHEERSFQNHVLRKAKKQKLGRQNLNTNQKLPPRAGFSEESLQKLEDFERKLVRLLGTLPANEIPLSQLPKEYEKTWGGSNSAGAKAMIRPKDYRCKKLGYLLEKHCSRTIALIQKPRSDDERSGVPTVWVRLKQNI